MSKFPPSLHQCPRYQKYNLNLIILTLLFFTSFHSFIHAAQEPSAEQLLNEWLVDDLSLQKTDQMLIDIPNFEQVFSGFALQTLDPNTVDSINQTHATNDRNKLTPDMHNSLDFIGNRHFLNQLEHLDFPAHNFYSNFDKISITNKEPKQILFSTFERNVSIYQSYLATSLGFEAITFRALFPREYVLEKNLNKIDFSNYVDQQGGYNWLPKNVFPPPIAEIQLAVDRLSRSLSNWDSDFIQLALNFFNDKTVLIDNAQLGLNFPLTNNSFKLVINDYTDHNEHQQFNKSYQVASPAVMQLTDETMSRNQFIEAESILIASKTFTLTVNTALIETQNNGLFNQENDDFSGNNFGWVESVKSDIAAQYFIPIEIGGLAIQVDYSYNDSKDESPNNQFSDSFNALNSRVTFQSQNNIWHVSAWIKNTTDQRHFKQNNSNFFDVQQVDYADPQTYGIHFKYKFD